MTCLWLYAYAIGVFSSRKLATACERNLAFLAIVGDDRPDFRTLSDFRKGHLTLMADLFNQVLVLPKKGGLGRWVCWPTTGGRILAKACGQRPRTTGNRKREK